MRKTLAAATALLVLFSAAWAADPKNGEYLLYAGGCISCHNEEDAPESEFLSGGRALATPFGTFYVPNITPEPDTGIGAWDEDDFIRAMRYGFSPEGWHYYPAFPYTAYAGIKDSDLRDLKAYLETVAPVRKQNKPHDLVWYVALRAPLRGWKWLYHDTRVFTPDSSRSNEWNRGAYLVRHLSHCAECHSPRDSLGAVDEQRLMAGNPHGPEDDKVPNITPSRDGIGGWSLSDIEYYLEIGMLPDGDFVGGAMTEVIDNSTSKLNAADRRAIAVYLQSLPPLPDAAP